MISQVNVRSFTPTRGHQTFLGDGEASLTLRVDENFIKKKSQGIICSEYIPMVLQHT